MFSVMMSGYEVDLYSQSHNPVVSIILLVLFVFIMSMVLLNCLIALMSGTALPPFYCKLILILSHRLRLNLL